MDVYIGEATLEQCKARITQDGFTVNEERSGIAPYPICRVHAESIEKYPSGSPRLVVEAYAPRPAAKTTEFDYTNQAWVQDGKYVRCGHPENMNCQCYGRIHEGEPFDGPVAERHEELLAGEAHDHPHSRFKTSNGQSVQWTYPGKDANA